MTNLFSSIRKSLAKVISPGEAAPIDPEHPAVVKSNPAYLLLGHTDLRWSVIPQQEIPANTLPKSSFPYVFRANRGGNIVHTGTINRGERNIAYFHLTKENGSTIVTYIPQAMLLQMEDEMALSIPAIRSLMKG